MSCTYLGCFRSQNHCGSMMERCGVALYEPHFMTRLGPKGLNVVHDVVILSKTDIHASNLSVIESSFCLA